VSDDDHAVPVFVLATANPDKTTEIAAILGQGWRSALVL